MAQCTRAFVKGINFGFTEPSAHEVKGVTKEAAQAL